MEGTPDISSDAIAPSHIDGDAAMTEGELLKGQNEFLMKLLETPPDKVRAKFNHLLEIHKHWDKKSRLEISDEEISSRFSKMGSAMTMIPQESIKSMDDFFSELVRLAFQKEFTMGLRLNAEFWAKPRNELAHIAAKYGVMPTREDIGKFQETVDKIRKGEYKAPKFPSTYRMTNDDYVEEALGQYASTVAQGHAKFVPDLVALHTFGYTLLYAGYKKHLRNLMPQIDFEQEIEVLLNKFAVNVCAPSGMGEAMVARMEDGFKKMKGSMGAVTVMYEDPDKVDRAEMDRQVRAFISAQKQN